MSELVTYLKKRMRVVDGLVVVLFLPCGSVLGVCMIASMYHRQINYWRDHFTDFIFILQQNLYNGTYVGILSNSVIQRFSDKFDGNFAG